MEFREKVRMLRQKKKLTQRELSELAQLDISQIGRIEAGDTKELKSEALRRLAEALDTSSDYLIGRRQGLDIEDLIQLHPASKQIFQGYAQLSERGKEIIQAGISLLLLAESGKLPRGLIHDLLARTTKTRGQEPNTRPIPEQSESSMDDVDLDSVLGIDAHGENSSTENA